MTPHKAIDGATLNIRNTDPSHPWRMQFVVELWVPGREPVELGLEHLRVERDELHIEWWSVGESFPELWEAR